MRDKPEYRSSSWLVATPVLAVFLGVGAVSALFGNGEISAVFMFLAALGTVSRLWAAASVKGVSLRVSSTLRGLFPGEEVDFTFEVRNDKLLPVVWLEVFCPLDRRLCLIPKEVRKPDEWEQLTLDEEGACTALVGERKFSFLLWYETIRYTSRWTARRRGIYSMAGWRLRTGDGLGLTQLERRLPPEDVRRFAVYPKLIPVSPALFLRNIWNADAGSRGVMEDPTVIRSTRDYMLTDPVRRMNWRLAARGLPLTVNVYEDILPRSVHFLFDGESFNGPPEHWEEMETALSILASEVVRLEREQVICGLSLPAGEGSRGTHCFASRDPHSLLQAMAAYQPMPWRWDEENSRYVSQSARFDEGPILEHSRQAGRFYYVTYHTDALEGNTLLSRLGREQLTLLTYESCPPYGDYETVCLQSLREGDDRG